MNTLLDFGVRHLAPEAFKPAGNDEFESMLVAMNSKEFMALYDAFDSPATTIPRLWTPESILEPGTLTEPAHEIPKEHFLTPATCFTLARPILALHIGKKLLAEETSVAKWMVTMAATDAEGNVARAVDKLRPGSPWGITERGKQLDPMADTLAFLIVSAAALKAPRISKPAKLAVATVLGTEAYKSVWAVQAGLKHRRATGGQLVIAPSQTGKIATAEKFTALFLAVLTNDLEPGWQRNLASAGALAAAGLGAVHGEKARRSYAPLIGKAV